MQARLLNTFCQENVGHLMRDLGVDLSGVRIMEPKGRMRLIYIKDIPSFTSNILKQEMLSLGGDVALPKEALFKKKNISCILSGTDSQIKRLMAKLKSQPYSLNKTAELIRNTLKDFAKDKFTIDTPRTKLNITRPLVMGIVNLTPDSFSGDGLVKENKKGKGEERLENLALRRVKLMVKEGADLVDVGGESTRPGAKKVSVEEELRRVIPAIKYIRKNFPKLPVSVDTYKPQVAARALKEGACIINDITALESKKMAELAAKEKAGVVLMHKKGVPLTMQKKPFYKDTVGQIYDFLDKRIQRAVDFGISKNRIIVDVGIGFGKRTQDNLKLIKYLYQFKSLGMPMLIGVSRKSFIGKVLNQAEPADRIVGTVASLAFSIANGARILRVHDVKEAVQAVRLSREIIAA